MPKLRYFMLWLVLKHLFESMLSCSSKQFDHANIIRTQVVPATLASPSWLNFTQFYITFAQNARQNDGAGPWILYLVDLEPCEQQVINFPTLLLQVKQRNFLQKGHKFYNAFRSMYLFGSGMLWYGIGQGRFKKIKCILHLASGEKISVEKCGVFMSFWFRVI